MSTARSPSGTTTAVEIMESGSTSTSSACLADISFLSW